MTGAQRWAFLAVCVLLSAAGCGSDSTVFEATGTVERPEDLDDPPEGHDWIAEDLVDALGLTRDAGTLVFTSPDGVGCFVDGVVTNAIEVTLQEQQGARILTGPDGEVGVFWYPEPRTSRLQETPRPYPGVPGSCKQDLEQRLADLGPPPGGS